MFMNLAWVQRAFKGAYRYAFRLTFRNAAEDSSILERVSSPQITTQLEREQPLRRLEINPIQLDNLSDAQGANYRPGFGQGVQGDSQGLNGACPGLRKLICTTVSVLILVGLSGCGHLESNFLSAQVSQFVSINDIQTMQVSGQFQVMGTANVPDKTLITVSAVRPLMIATELQSPENPSNQQTRYTILDRQQVEVLDGTWQTELALAGAQTGYESWQATTQELNGAVTPQPQVDFIATLDPSQQSFKLRQQLSQDDTGFEQGYIRLNDDGELYAIATETLEISPPKLDRAPNLSLEQAQPPNRETAQAAGASDALELNRSSSTNLPLKPEAFFR